MAMIEIYPVMPALILFSAIYAEDLLLFTSIDVFSR